LVGVVAAEEALHDPELHQCGGEQEEYLDHAGPLDVALRLLQGLLMGLVTLYVELLVSRDVQQTLVHSVQGLLQNLYVPLVDDLHERVLVVVEVETHLFLLPVCRDYCDVDLSFRVVVIELQIVAGVIEDEAVLEGDETCDIVLLAARGYDVERVSALDLEEHAQLRLTAV
jgi:hypothetical protein